VEEVEVEMGWDFVVVVEVVVVAEEEVEGV
jgi:hypothetical protein